MTDFEFEYRPLTSSRSKRRRFCDTREDTLNWKFQEDEEFDNAILILKKIFNCKGGFTAMQLMKLNSIGLFSNSIAKEAPPSEMAKTEEKATNHAVEEKPNGKANGDFESANKEQNNDDNEDVDFERIEGFIMMAESSLESLCFNQEEKNRGVKEQPANVAPPFIEKPTIDVLFERESKPKIAHRPNGIGCIERNQHTWEQRIVELKSFSSQFGHTRVSRRHPIKWKSLAYWVENLRCIRRGTKTKRRLTAEQIRELDSLGFEWNFAT